MSTSSPPQTWTADEREHRLRSLFESFAFFGVPKNTTSGTMQEPLMDSKNFLKFFRDQGLLDSKLNATTLDLHFTKAKAQFKRVDRKLPWEAFLYALELAAVTKYGAAMSEADSLETLINEAIQSHGPIARSTVPVADGVYSKLTDGSLYTGQHRDKPTGNTIPSSQYIHESKSRSVNNPPSESSSNLLSAVPTKVSVSNTTISSTSQIQLHNNPKNTPVGSRVLRGSSQIIIDPSESSSEFTLTQPEIPKGSVFDRLTNPKGYTGSHKERFGEDGRGKGKAGRVQDDIGTKSLEYLVVRK